MFNVDSKGCAGSLSTTEERKSVRGERRSLVYVAAALAVLKSLMQRPLSSALCVVGQPSL